MESAAPPGGDVSIAYVVAVPTIITVAVAALLTVVRLYVRIRLLKGLEWDDFFNVLATVTVFVVLGLTLGATSNGVGRHTHYLDKAKASIGIELLRICEFFLILSTVFIKISISLFLKRLFFTGKRWRRFLWTFITFNTITSLLDAAIIFPQCDPVELNWDKSVKGHCWSNAAINATGIAQGGTTAFSHSKSDDYASAAITDSSMTVIAASTDFVLATLPIVFLWNVSIKRRVKLGICGIMALGFASGGFALARTALVPRLTITHDPTWDLVHLFLWANLEATFGVIAAAAPTVRTLFGHNAVAASLQPSNSNSIPLRHSHKSYASRRSWFRGTGAPPSDDFENLKSLDAADRTSDSGGSQVKLWAQETGRIVKTTDVRVHSSTRASRGPDLEAGALPDAAVPDPVAAYLPRVL